MRKSLMGLEHMAQKDDYPGLPEELREYAYRLTDSGRCLMCVPESFEGVAFAAGEDPSLYEAAVPTRYVLEKGWRIREGCCIVDVPYDDALGVVVPNGYDEF